MGLKQKILAWQEANDQLKIWKETESALRDELAEELFPHASEGTNTKELPYGVAKCVHGYNVKIDSKRLKEAAKDLPPKTRKAIVKTSYSLNKKTYATLTEEQRDTFDECITRTPSKPRLTFEFSDE